jgi:hypothetical protein
MKKNMGSIDKAARVFAALTVVVLYLTSQITGTAAIVLGIVAAVFVATSIISYCPLYTALKINTGKVQEK